MTSNAGQIDLDWGDDLPLTTSERGYDVHHRRLAKLVILRWVKRNGWTCPGIGVPAHVSHDLVADHVKPLSEGGETVLGNLRAICRACNTRRLHPRSKLCPDGHRCSRTVPSGSPFCCGEPSGQ